MEKHGENKDNNLYVEIEKISKINAQNIDAANYFMSLVSEAVDAGITAESETVYMQSQISDILADLIWQYNAGASTSVKTQTAADLVESVIFALDFFCISAVKADDSVLSYENCVEMLREKAGIKNCYAKGLENIAPAFNHAQNLYNKLLANKLNIGIASYNAVVNKSLASVLKKYDVRFFPHKTSLPIPFDYPLALSEEINKYKGILYVNGYLRYLLLENEFCTLFDLKDIQRLLKLYANDNGFIVSELMENIFEKVFANILFSMLANSENVSLSVRREQYNKIAENFYDNGICRDETSVESLICKYVQKLIINLKIENPELQKYIFKYQKKFAKNILPAIQQNYLHNLIIYDDIYILP